MTVWTKGALLELRRRYDSGDTFAAIAIAMGTSRSAVAGIANRLDLPKRGPRPRQGPRPYSARKPRPTAPRVLPRYVAIREPTAPPVHHMTKREIEADFAVIWANTARLLSPP